MRSLRRGSLLVLGVLLLTCATARAQVVINEVMYRPYNQGSAGHYEFVELYNNGSQAVDLSDLILTDDENLTAVCSGSCLGVTEGAWHFPSGTSIASHSYLTLWRYAVAGVTDQPGNLVYSPSTCGSLVLSDGGDTVTLLRCNGTQPETVDSLNYGTLDLSATPENVSLERIDPTWPTQDALNWRRTSVAPGTNPGSGYVPGGTPGQANTNATTPAVIINEVMYRPYNQSTNGQYEFIELYNKSPDALDLGGVIVTDAENLSAVCGGCTGVTEGVYYIPAGTTIGPYSFLTLWHTAVTGVTDQPHNLVYDGQLSCGNLVLADGGDSISVLRCNNGPQVLDSLNYDTLGVAETGQNVSLERVCASCPTQQAATWSASLVNPGTNTGGYVPGGTPGGLNSVDAYTCVVTEPPAYTNENSILIHGTCNSIGGSVEVVGGAAPAAAVIDESGHFAVRVTLRLDVANTLTLTQYDAGHNAGYTTTFTVTNEAMANLWYSVSDVPGGSTGAVYADTAVTFLGQVYLFRVDESDHKIYATRGDPTTAEWSAWDVVLDEQTALTSVAAVAHGDRLFLVWVGYDSHFMFLASTINGTDWVREGAYGLPMSVAHTASTISAIVWYGRAYVFFKSEEDYPRHYFIAFNGPLNQGSITVPHEVGPTSEFGTWTPYADTATAYGDKLWLFSVGIDGTHWYNTYDGYDWSGWTPLEGGGTTAVPTHAITFNNRLHLFAIGTGDHQHYVNVYDGAGWSGWHRIPGLVSSTVSDTATVFQDQLWLFSVSSLPEGRHSYAGCRSDLGCGGGGTDNGDAVLYSGTNCTGSSRKLSATGTNLAEGATRNNIRFNLSGETFPYPSATLLSQTRCTWVRSGYRLTLCTEQNFAGGCVDYDGDEVNHSVLPGIQSLRLTRAPTLLWNGLNQESLGVGESVCDGGEAWNENFQTIAHSDRYFFTSRSDPGRIRRYPITRPEDAFCGNGYDASLELDAHLGTLVYFRDPGKPGYLYVPAGSYGLQLYDEDLNLVADNVPNSGWGPINPVDGLTYAIGGGPDWDHTVYVSKRVYDPEDNPYPTRLELMYSFGLTQYYTPPNPKTLKCVQGADFSPQGFLYLASEGSNRSWDGYCDSNKDDAGIYVFSLFGGMYGVSAQFENRIVRDAPDQYFEAQAMVVWDTNIRSDAAPWANWGQLHYAVRLNRVDVFDHDAVQFWHYGVPPWTW